MADAANVRDLRDALPRSKAFQELFRDGMALVEETASYLDKTGRQDSKKLDRTAALAYATESMRLTTRLMQGASWLLLHRAVKEGEMSLAKAGKEKMKVKLRALDEHDEVTFDKLPGRLQELVVKSRFFLQGIIRMDAAMHGEPPSAGTQSNAPMEQLRRLQKEFGGG